MIGAFLIIFLSAVVSMRLKRQPAAARTALGFAVGIGAPILAISALGRVGIHAGTFTVIGVFVVITGLVLAITTRYKDEEDDTRWLGVYAVSFLIAAITALVGRSPTIGVLVDPWAHMAWSRDLTTAHTFYPPGLPALDAILRTDHGLAGAFRMAPTILHAALAAQFLALGECVKSKNRSAAPAIGLLVSLAAIAYLIVPVAFGKFDPPRPELMAAVFVTASWWMIVARGKSLAFRSITLGFFTCAAFVTHFSNLEIAHIIALGLTIAFGSSGTPIRRLLLLLGSIAMGLAVSLAISPWPLTLIFNRDALPYAAVFHSNVTIPSPLAIARMYGLGLSVAGAACALWIVLNLPTAYRLVKSALVGLCVFGVVVVLPLFAAALGINIPISLAAYRFFLAAALPLAILIGLTSSLTRRRPAAGMIVAAVCFCFLALDVTLRAVLTPLLVLATAALVAGWWTLTRTQTTRRLGLAAALALIAATAIRIAIWLPQPPSEATWLNKNGDPHMTVVTNWPLTNALDALVDQPVIDGLAGNDGNVARHRSMVLSPLHDRIDWCGDDSATSVESLIETLEELEALPAYLIVGNRFAESWRLYSEQHARRIDMGDIEDHPFYAAPPCEEPPADRITRIRAAIAAHDRTSLEFDDEGVTVYRVE